MPHLRHLLGLLILLLTLAALPLAGFAQGTDKKDTAAIEAIEAQKKQEQAALEAEKKRTGQQLNAKRREKKTVAGQLRAIDEDLIAARGRLESLRGRLARQQDEMARMRAQYDRSEAEYSAAQGRLSTRLRTWYKSRRTPLISIFFQAQGATDLAYRLRYAEAALDSDRSTLALLNEQQQIMEATRVEMQAEMGKTTELASQVDAERANYQGLRNEKATVLASVNRDVRQLESAYRELEQSSLEIEYFLQGLRDGGSPTFGGTFIHPLPKARLSSGFGYRHHPVLKRRKLHTGLDLAAKAGTPIRAAAAGTVVFAGWKGGYGKCVVINHGRGFATLYGHMSAINLRNGQQVNQGSIVGKVGSTGMSTGNHLHFEVRINGKPVNPAPYV